MALLLLSARMAAAVTVGAAPIRDSCCVIAPVYLLYYAPTVSRAVAMPGPQALPRWRPHPFFHVVTDQRLPSPVEQGSECPSNMSFNELGLSPHILRAVKELGYEQPTPSSSKPFPPSWPGRTCWAAPDRHGQDGRFHPAHAPSAAGQPWPGRSPSGTCPGADPDRELAAQVGESIIKYAHHLPFRTLIAYGGVSIKPNLDAIKLGVDILVATPGRLLDLLTQEALSPWSALEVLVLDEAGQNARHGLHHRHPPHRMKALPDERQTLLFSATFSDDIKALADDLLKGSHPHRGGSEQHRRRAGDPAHHQVDRERRREMLSHMIGRGNWQRVLVFVRTKQIADRLAQQMQKDGLDTVAIHGDKSQGPATGRWRISVRAKVRVLVATDIAARGLDIDQLPHVINFELPQMAEDYIHRIGRTSRAGRGGRGHLLVSQDELGSSRRSRH